MRTPAAILMGLLALFAPAAEAQAPERVVSINLCTDQLAMLIAAPGQLIAVSRAAGDPVASAMWREANAFPAVPPDAEAVYHLRPDLVLAGAYDSPGTLGMLRRLGVRVETFGLETSFDDVRRQVRRMGDLLGAPERAERLVAEMDEALAAEPSPSGARPSAALYYANGYTSGSGTLADEILAAAGYANAPAERGVSGLSFLPLETLVMIEPDLLVLGQDYRSPALAQAVLRHPAVRALGAARTGVADNLWVCGTPLAVRAVAELRAARPR